MADTPTTPPVRPRRGDGPEMKEAKFWHDLEARVCRELAGIGSAGRHGLWCDGFIPEHFDFGKTSQIRGHVWIGVGPREHEKWQFTVHVNQKVTEREGIDWPGLLPPNDVTSWMKVDTVGKRMAIEPGAALPIVR